jgi:hypothetical protein
MIVNYNSQKNNGKKIGVPSLYGFEGKASKGKDDNFYNGVRSAI